MAPIVDMTQEPEYAYQDVYKIFIATEDSYGKGIYLRALNRCVGRRVELYVESTSIQMNDATPNRLVRRIREKTKTQVLNPDDQLWVVCDVDDRGGWLEELQNNPENQEIHWAISNPMFEIWLALHSPQRPDDEKMTCIAKDLQAGSRTSICEQLQVPPSNKKNFPYHTLLPHLSKAVQYGKERDTDPSRVIPEFSVSRIYRLVECIQKLSGETLETFYSNVRYRMPYDMR